MLVILSKGDGMAINQFTAASTFAGESSFGSDNIDITDMMIDSTPKTGRQRSSAVSCKKTEL